LRIESKRALLFQIDERGAVLDTMKK